MAVSATLVGLVMLTMPEQFRAPRYDDMRPYLLWYGATFLAGGLGLLATQIWLRIPQVAVWSAHLMVASAMFASVPPLLAINAWTGVAQYGGMGLLLADVPGRRAEAGAGRYALPSDAADPGTRCRRCSATHHLRGGPDESSRGGNTIAGALAARDVSSRARLSRSRQRWTSSGDPPAVSRRRARTPDASAQRASRRA